MTTTIIARARLLFPLSLVLGIATGRMYSAEKFEWPAISAKHEASLGTFKERDFCVLVCVYDIQRKALNVNYEVVEFRATVVRSLKGDWKVGQKLRCDRDIDRGARFVMEDGELLFLFTGGAGKDNVVSLSNGELPAYEEELLALLLKWLDRVGKPTP